MLGVKHGVFWSWVTGWVGSPCCSTACIPAWTASDTPSARLLPYCLHSCLACSRHTKRICTMLKCVVQINLLGQLALWRAMSTLWSKQQSSSLCWALAQPLVEAT